MKDKYTLNTIIFIINNIYNIYFFIVCTNDSDYCTNMSVVSVLPVNTPTKHQSREMNSNYEILITCLQQQLQAANTLSTEVRYY